MKNILIKAFCIQLINFIDELCEIYPNEHKIDFYRTILKTFIKSNSNIVYKYFLKYVLIPYRNLIETRNENELLNIDMTKDQAFELVKDDVPDANEFYKYANIIEQIDLKRLWIGMSSETKESVWNYFEEFIKISDKIGSN